MSLYHDVASVCRHDSSLYFKRDIDTPLCQSSRFKQFSWDSNQASATEAFIWIIVALRLGTMWAGWLVVLQWVDSFGDLLVSRSEYCLNVSIRNIITQNVWFLLLVKYSLKTLTSGHCVALCGVFIMGINLFKIALSNLII